VTLVLIGLVGGIITGLSPCVLPVLPVVLLGGGSAGPDTGPDAESARRRPYLVVLGLTLSFAVFTLFGSLILASLHLPDDAIRWLGLALLLLVGLGLLVPPLGHLIERPFYRFPQRAVGTGRNGFLLGIALGAVFVPCAGPVLAAITVAGATGHIVIVLAVALTFNLSDIIQRNIPNYFETVGNSLEKGAKAAPQGGGSVSLQACQTAALYGGSGLEKCGPAPAFSGIQQWLNTPGGKPVSLASLKGKVVLVDFWAYSCINCQRELPHVEAWARAYAADGLEVVGVHTPEYAFEHVPSNVADGVRRLGLTFPVALDNSYSTWNAYDNQSWPAGYLIDASGQIRHVSIGEGDDSGEERLIRQLLSAAHPGMALPRATDVPDTTPDDSAMTPETYLGAERQQGYHGSTRYATGQFTAPATLPADSFALAGAWTIGQESITAGQGAGITLAFHASKVYLDVGGTGTLTVSAGGTSKIIRVSGAPDIYTVATEQPARDGTVTIRLSPGLQAYSFTFG
jgi:cytochrome c biogenesis protein CcdA/thiol-disulfide isomerase/thioredoxin